MTRMGAAQALLATIATALLAAATIAGACAQEKVPAAEIQPAGKIGERAQPIITAPAQPPENAAPSQSAPDEPGSAQPGGEPAADRKPEQNSPQPAPNLPSQTFTLRGPHDPVTPSGTIAALGIVPGTDGSWRYSKAPPDSAFGAYQMGRYLTAFLDATKRVSSNPEDAAAMTLLGELYRDGLGVKQNPAEAFKWYKLAEARGDRQAAFAMARAYIEGAGVEANHASAKEYFERAGAKNHAAALYNLGIMAIEGEIQNFQKAADYFKRGVDNGDLDSVYALSLLYRQGQGVEKDDVEATRLMKLAADRHHLAAMVEYAIALFNGKGAEADERGAAVYLIRAAWRNAPVAQNRLARMYSAGRGVKSDLVEAMKWHALASANGLKDPWLDAKMTQLSKTQREMVEEAVRKFGGR